MDGILMNKQLEISNQLSEESWKKLLTYFEDNTLTLQERCSLLNEITGHKDTSKVPDTQKSTNTVEKLQLSNSVHSPD